MIASPVRAKQIGPISQSPPINLTRMLQKNPKEHGRRANEKGTPQQFTTCSSILGIQPFHSGPNACPRPSSAHPFGPSMLSVQPSPTSANPFQPIQPGLPDSASAQPGSPFVAHNSSPSTRVVPDRAESCQIVPNRTKSRGGGGPSAHPLSIISRCAFCRQSLACGSRPFCK
jgi:hypothetical protein